MLHSGATITTEAPGSVAVTDSLFVASKLMVFQCPAVLVAKQPTAGHSYASVAIRASASCVIQNKYSGIQTQFVIHKH